LRRDRKEKAGVKNGNTRVVYDFAEGGNAELRRDFVGSDFEPKKVKGLGIDPEGTKDTHFGFVGWNVDLVTGIFDWDFVIETGSRTIVKSDDPLSDEPGRGRQENVLDVGREIASSNDAAADEVTKLAVFETRCVRPRVSLALVDQPDLKPQGVNKPELSSAPRATAETAYGFDADVIGQPAKTFLERSSEARQ